MASNQVTRSTASCLLEGLPRSWTLISPTALSMRVVLPVDANYSMIAACPYLRMRLSDMRFRDSGL